MDNDSNIVLDLKTNDTYITNVEEFRDNLSKIEYDSNIKEYLINMKRYLETQKYSNRQQVLNIINNSLNENSTNLEGDDHGYKL